ncbi:hypothetical protein BDK92_5683 [Micromonospora pisi]|uniref:Uncharacterized protein n=1 Tax=Micromonospora pisi TaxID=589240 RepID=A0A495JQN3_9ACTN|nr:hypothetical protein [Micromonospora pisi]RKR91290.1 hypothetical protein BDK92_5683 [Micromonospora pisi]
MSTKDGASTAGSTSAEPDAEVEVEQARPETSPASGRAPSMLSAGRGAGPHQNFAIGVSGRTRRRPRA